MRHYFRHYIIFYISVAVIYPEYAHADNTDNFKKIDKLFETTDLIINDNFHALQKAVKRSYEGLSDRIEVRWGRDIILPTPKRWVTYADNFGSRVALDYENGIATFETLLPTENGQVNTNLSPEIAIEEITSLLALVTEADTQELENSDQFRQLLKEQIKPRSHVGQPESKEEAPPRLSESAPTSGISSNHQKKTTPESELLEFSPSEVREKLADALVNAQINALAESQIIDNLNANLGVTESEIRPPTPADELSARPTELTRPLAKIESREDAGIPKKLTLTIPFISSYQEKLITRYIESINELATMHSIPPSLILAIIEAESSFNPRATSPIPAFGLMQIVPQTAGRDASRFLFGQDQVFTPDYLYDELNNLNIGTAYFNLLFQHYWEGIQNEQNRFLCVIASYNTGLGNVAKTFTGGRSSLREATSIVNKMTPEEVKAHLIDHLPAQETKDYIAKIMNFQQKYRSFDGESS